MMHSLPCSVVDPDMCTELRTQRSRSSPTNTALARRLLLSKLSRDLAVERDLSKLSEDAAAQQEKGGGEQPASMPLPGAVQVPPGTGNHPCGQMHVSQSLPSVLMRIGGSSSQVDGLAEALKEEDSRIHVQPRQPVQEADSGDSGNRVSYAKFCTAWCA